MAGDPVVAATDSGGDLLPTCARKRQCCNAVSVDDTRLRVAIEVSLGVGIWGLVFGWVAGVIGLARSLPSIAQSVTQSAFPLLFWNVAAHKPALGSSHVS